ncbi:alpha/beta hydrolase [Sandarakinorhabdus rubra]|uniref:alpha/beta hydrolase n=1 Tax=Sandarakinorhabdus rubra TaxID=2672568 RepID=UPI0013DA251D|nr:alpha/beta hydrolase [Sandarakinorhabdus rubra]
MVDDYGMGCSGPGLAACRVTPVQIGGMAAEWLVPPGAGDARIVYLHGGGWVAGSPTSHRAIAAEFAHRTGQPVLLPDYRLAPEHPFPSALIDAAAALVHAASNGPDDARPADRLSLAGDSAGGNLAAVIAMGLGPVDPVPPIDRLLLICPFLSVDNVVAGFAGLADDPAVSPEAMAMVATFYAPELAATDPRLSPLHANAAALARLPRTLVQASAAETLRGQALQFTQRLWVQQHWARLSLWPDMPHVWHAFIGKLPEASAAIAEAALFLVD